MNILSLLSSVQAPGGLWTILINWLQSGIGNFGWTILLLTILVKLVISPLDFGVKFTTKQQTLVQQKCAPQIEKIKKKFGKDQNSVRIQTQSLYKREGLKTGVGCIVMLVNLVLTMVIFFTLYSSLKTNSSYQAIKQYETLEQTYTDSYYSNLASFKDDDDITSENANKVTEDYYAADKFLKEHQETDEGWTEQNEIFEKYKDAIISANSKAEKDTLAVWKDIKANWLWVDNIWVADASTKPFPTYESAKSAAGKGYKEYFEQNIDEQRYTTISNLINNEGGRSQNGYYILAVLAAVITFLTQYITELHTKLKNKKANVLAKNATDATMGASMKMMKIIMPIIMLIFVLTSSASFGIYILASNVASIAFGEIETLIINRVFRNKQAEVEEALEKEANRMIKKGKLQEK